MFTLNNDDYLQFALCKFNGGAGWYSWKKLDDDGNKIPNSERMQYKYIKIIKDGATMPSEADVNAKIQELKDADIVPEYVKLRLTEYPPIGDQLDMLWHSIDENAELKQKYFAFYEAIKAVKAKYPK